MSIELRRANARQMRERIVDFFWRIQMWPYSTKEQYYRLWDWRYTALSESDPAVWIALDDDIIVGHIALCFRNLSVDNQQIRVGVLTNFRVDEAYRSGALAAALAGAPRAAVRRGELDLLMGYGNRSAHQMVVALGYLDLGRMQTLVRVLRWGPALVRRSPKLQPAAALCSAAARVQRAFRRARVPKVPSFLAARTLSAAEIQTIDRSHWKLGTSMTWNGSLNYYANRFCGSEFCEGRVLGVVDTRSNKVEAVTAVTGSSQLTILECETNRDVLSTTEAVEAVAQASPDADSVRVPLLPGTDLAEKFIKAGYVRLPAAYSDPTIYNTFWSAWWPPEHPLASQMSKTNHWNLWLGWSHH